MRLADIAKSLNGEIIGNDVEIYRVAKIEEAEHGDITFLANPKYKKYLITTNASAVLISRNEHFVELDKRSSSISLVKVDDPYRAFLHLIDIFHPPIKPKTYGIDKTAIISPTACIGSDVSIGAYVVIGERTSIGNKTTIYPGTVIDDDVIVGEGCTIYSNVSIREQCKIGNRVIIHAGTVIGSDGFGFAPKEDGSYEKIPQRGNVVIEDDVEVGANCTIDRATLGETIIKRGVKLDNLIHVAHNVVIGEDTVIAAQTGISGSTKIGKQCALGGQVGLTGHITIADKTKIGAQSGVPKSINESGKTYFGYPAREIHETLRIEGAIRQLPQLLVEFRELQKRIERLEQVLKLQLSEKK